MLNEGHIVQVFLLFRSPYTFNNPLTFLRIMVVSSLQNDERIFSVVKKKTKG